MKIRLTYFALLLFAVAHSQTVEFALQKSGTTFFSGNIYSFGLTSSGKTAKLAVYKISPALKTLDSLFVDIGKHTPDDFLLVSSDTLHDYLNIYLQRKERKLVTIIRLSKQFKLIASIENVDIARLNSISAFQNEIQYYKNEVYNIKVSAGDSAGKQFFLDKYVLKSDQKNFEYEQKWQFPFERKNIHSAHIAGVFKNQVVLYVNIINGPKAGQWILRIDRKEGRLIRGTKIGSKGDLSFYSLGIMEADTATASLFILGQKFPASDLSQSENKINISGKPFATVYLATIDSAGEIHSRDEFKFPIVEPKGNKAANAYLLRPSRLLKHPEGGFSFITDVYKGNGLGCYVYCTTLSNTLTVTDEKLIADKGTISTNTVIEKYYFNSDKTDMSGKLCCDSLVDFERLYYKKMPLPVKLAFRIDPSSGPLWLLHKSDVKKMSEDISVVKTDKKVMQAQKLEEISKAENPLLLVLSPNTFLLARQTQADKLVLKLLSW